MKKLWMAGALLAGLAIAFPALAADSLKAAMTQFGLIGEWAAQCSQPPSRDNAHSHWSANSNTEGGLLTDFGGGRTMTYRATFAELVGTDRIRLRLLNSDKTQLELVIRKTDGHTQTLSSVRSDGSALIKDGKIVATSDDTVMQERCN